MSSAKEIRSRISSIRDTQKITNAMNLIASTKLRKAKAELDQTRPYFNALNAEIKRIFRMSDKIRSPYFYPPEGSTALDGTYGCLVITADKGLAGAYNQNIIKETMKMLQDHPDTKLFVVGEYGRQFFTQRHIPVEHSFLYTAQNPTMQRAREISTILLNGFLGGSWQKIYVLYTDMKNGMDADVHLERLLPFHRAAFYNRNNDDSGSSQTIFEFEPSLDALLDAVMPSYVSGYIYSALVDSFCSEQNARMNAMSAATNNAQSLLEDLQMQYNQVRQAAITREITEISAGAKAQKRKKQKGS